MRAILIISFLPICGVGQTDTASPFVPLVNISGTSVKLPGVKGMAVDVEGNVYFASGGYSATSVLRWAPGTGALTSVAGNGTPGYSGDNGPATSAQLDGVAGLAVDATGNLYIADSTNRRVRKVSNGIITTVARGGDCLADFSADCQATHSNLSEITGITADASGNLYIFNQGIVLRVANGVISNFLGYSTLYPHGGTYTSGAAAVDSAGNLYVADFEFHHVLKVSNGVITIVAGAGVAGFTGDGGPAGSAQLTGPQGVAVDAAGNVYIADTGNQRIRKVSGGVITTVAGGGAASGGLGDNGPATGALLNYPFGVGVDSAGNLYVEDTPDNRIRKVSNGVITTVAGGGSTSVLLARSAGIFTNTGAMSTPRANHTAILLEGGKVLVAGVYSTSAELYDPVSGTFAATGNLPSTLFVSGATLLPDGKVLIVSNIFPSPSLPPMGLAGAQLYDPSNGVFTPSGNTQSLLFAQTQTLLNNGKILVTGRTSLGPDLGYGAELYDPVSGTFTLTGRPKAPHADPTATLLPDGKVLLAEGNCDSYGGPEIYDSTTGTFSTTGALACTLGHLATLLANGKVLITGGANGWTVYDPAKGTFSGADAIEDQNQSATLLPDGSVLLTGGNPCLDLLCMYSDADDPSVADGTLYDPAARTFGPAGMMTKSRDSHRSTLLADGRVLITGGETDVTLLSSAEIYTPPVLTPAPALFSVADGGPQGAIWHTATGQIASALDPAVTGEVLSIYTTSLIDGGVVPPQVAIGGKFAEVIYFGDAPGYPGYNQVNIRVPGGVTPGSEVPVRLTYFSRPSNTVTIGSSDLNLETKDENQFCYSASLVGYGRPRHNSAGAIAGYVFRNREHGDATRLSHSHAANQRHGFDRRWLDRFHWTGCNR